MLGCDWLSRIVYLRTAVRVFAGCETYYDSCWSLSAINIHLLRVQMRFIVYKSSEY